MNQTDQYYLIIVHNIEKHFLIKTRVHKLFRNYHLTLNVKNQSSPSKAAGLSKIPFLWEGCVPSWARPHVLHFDIDGQNGVSHPNIVCQAGIVILCFAFPWTQLGDLGEIGTHELFLTIQDVAAEIDAWDVVGVLKFIWLILRPNQMNWRLFNQEAAFSANNIILSSVSSWDKRWTC